MHALARAGAVAAGVALGLAAAPAALAAPTAPTLIDVTGDVNGHIAVTWTNSADMAGVAFTAVWVGEANTCGDQAGGSPTPNNCRLSGSNGNENAKPEATTYSVSGFYAAGSTHYAQVCHFVYGTGYYCSNVKAVTMPQKPASTAATTTSATTTAATTTAATSTAPAPGGLPAIAPAALPAANGSLACAAARTLLQRMNADAQKANEDIIVHTALTKSAVAKVAAAVKAAQQALDESAALARQICAQTPAQARDFGEVPADNGTASCHAARDRVLYDNGELKKLYGNRDFTRPGPAGRVRLAQIEQRIQRLKADLAAWVPKARAACAKG